MTGTLGDMVSRIGDELVRTDLDTQITAAITSAIEHYRSERWWFTEVRDKTLSLTNSLEFYPLFDDFAELDQLRIIIGRNFIPVDQQHYDTIQTWQTNNIFGQPTDFAIYDNLLFMYPIPSQPYTLLMSYVKEVPLPTSPVDTNEFFTYGEEMIRARARADVMVNVLRDDMALQEYLMMGAEPFYSRRESIAYQAMRGRSERRVSGARIRGVAW